MISGHREGRAGPIVVSTGSLLAPFATTDRLSGKLDPNQANFGASFALSATGHATAVVVHAGNDPSNHDCVHSRRPGGAWEQCEELPAGGLFEPRTAVNGRGDLLIV